MRQWNPFCHILLQHYSGVRGLSILDGNALYYWTMCAEDRFSLVEDNIVKQQLSLLRIFVNPVLVQGFLVWSSLKYLDPKCQFGE